MSGCWPEGKVAFFKRSGTNRKTLREYRVEEYIWQGKNVHKAEHSGRRIYKSS